MSKEITVTVDELISPIIGGGIPTKWSVHCETNHDKELLEKRLPKVSDLAYDLLCGMAEIAFTWRDDNRYSASACAKFCDREIAGIISSVLDYLSDDTKKMIFDSTFGVDDRR